MTDEMVAVLELCIRRAVEVEPSRRKAGFLAGNVAAFVDEWARMMRDSGNQEPTLMEWGEWANVKWRTAYRRQQQFRLLFGQWHETPTVLARHVNRSRAAASTSSVPSSLVPALTSTAVVWA